MSLYRLTYTDKKTGAKKESAVWWFEFIYAGKRYRESTQTTRKTLAAETEKRRRLEVERLLATGVRRADPGQMLRTVTDAVTSYQASYDAPNHREKSIAWVNERCPHLVKRLGNVALFDLTKTRVLGYMRARRDEGASNRTINMELLCLARAAGATWRQLWPDVQRLEESTDTGRALSPEEEGRLIWAAQQSKSPYIESFIRIALGTGMRAGEIRGMQLSRIDLTKRELRVGKAKTAAGQGRGIPMNEDLHDAISKQVEWLKRTFGSPKPTWFLFPFCDRSTPMNPEKPVTTVKSSWDSARTAANVVCRFHDLRHTAATKMAENGTPDATMKALLGHMSQTMIERYSHVRGEAKREAVEGLTVAKPIAVVPQVSPKVRETRFRKTS